MNNIFSSTLNTRPILSNSFRFIRSDVPTIITEEEKAWLLDKNITLIIDLRTNDEALKKPCPLEKDKRFQYCSMPVTGGNVVPSSVNDVSNSYIRMADEQMSNIINKIWLSKDNVLYFCNAGKDRTGVVSAILLLKLGMDIDYIVNDYMKSKFNLKAMLESYAINNPTVDINVITPHDRYIKEFVEWFLLN